MRIIPHLLPELGVASDVEETDDSVMMLVYTSISHITCYGY